MIRLLLIPILIALSTLSAPLSTKAATECAVGNMSGLKVNGQCVYFTKGDDAYSAYGCSANNPNGYGVSQFPCPQELIKMWEDKKAAEQKAILDKHEEAKRLADEELDKKIQQAVEEKLKQQEKIRQEEARNDQVVPTQAPVITTPIVVPTVSPQPTSPSVPVKVITKTLLVPTPAKDVSEENIENPIVSESAPVDVVPSSEKKPSVWANLSGFFSRLNPFSWFK